MTPFHHQHTICKTPFPEVNSDFLIAKPQLHTSLLSTTETLSFLGFLFFFLLLSSFVFSALCLVFLFPIYILSCWNAVVPYILSSSHPVTSPRYLIPAIISTTIYILVIPRSVLLVMTSPISMGHIPRCLLDLSCAFWCLLEISHRQAKFNICQRKLIVFAPPCDLASIHFLRELSLLNFLYWLVITLSACLSK